MGEQRVALEDGVDRPAVGLDVGHVAPADLDVPLVGSSKPAIMRSVVVLPQPDGPMIEKNSAVPISRSRLATATRSPKRLCSAAGRRPPQLTAGTMSRKPARRVGATEPAGRCERGHGEAHERDREEHHQHADGVDLGRQAEADQPEEHDRQG